MFPAVLRLNVTFRICNVSEAMEVALQRVGPVYVGRTLSGTGTNVAEIRTALSDLAWPVRSHPPLNPACVVTHILGALSTLLQLRELNGIYRKRNEHEREG